VTDVVVGAGIVGASVAYHAEVIEGLELEELQGVRPHRFTTAAADCLACGRRVQPAIIPGGADA